MYKIEILKKNCRRNNQKMKIYNLKIEKNKLKNEYNEKINVFEKNITTFKKINDMQEKN